MILLSNAIQYSLPGSEITVSLRAKGSHRVLTVHNTGSYIDPGSTGLGLAIAGYVC